MNQDYEKVEVTEFDKMLQNIGRCFEQSIFKKYSNVLFKKSRYYNQPKACFKNSFGYAKLKEVTYCYGYIDFNGIPIEHAWIKENGEYKELTIEDNTGINYYEFYSLDSHELKYFKEAPVGFEIAKSKRKR